MKKNKVFIKANNCLEIEPTITELETLNKFGVNVKIRPMKYKLKVSFYEEAFENFKDYCLDEEFEIYSNCRNYDFVSGHFDKLPFEWDAISEIPQKASENGYYIKPFNAYIHGGITISEGNFNCPWDSGLGGFVMIKKTKFAELRNKEINSELDKCFDEESTNKIKELNAILTNSYYEACIQDEFGDVVTEFNIFWGDDSREQLNKLFKFEDYGITEEDLEYAVNHIR